MTKTTEEAILQQLRCITRILLMDATKGQKRKEQIGFLSDAGFEPKEIAELLGISANSVSVTLAKIRKQGKATKRGKSRRASNTGKDR